MNERPTIRARVATERGSLEENADATLVDDVAGLYVVTDGRGSRTTGRAAAELTIRSFQEEMAAGRPTIDRFRRRRDHPSKLALLDLLEAAADRISTRVHAWASDDPERRGSGAMIVAAVVVDRFVFVVHVGNSRAYLLRRGRLEPLTEDHTAFNDRLRRRGSTGPMSLEASRIAARAIGVYPHVEADSVALDVAPGDRLLLCSDGLAYYFDNDASGLSALLAGDGLEEVPGRLVARALERGGRDNATAIVLEVGGPGRTVADKLALRRKILSGVPLFRDLTETELMQVLQVAGLEEYDEGQTIVREGDEGDRFFVVLSGYVEVFRSERSIRSVGPGEPFGDLALIRDRPRSASVRSDGPSELISIRRDDLRDIMERRPNLAVKILWSLAGSLGDWIVDSRD